MICSIISTVPLDLIVSGGNPPLIMRLKIVETEQSMALIHPSRRGMGIENQAFFIFSLHGMKNMKFNKQLKH
jgi:hypothetical protein